MTASAAPAAAAHGAARLSVHTGPSEHPPTYPTASVQSSSWSHLAAGCNRRAAAATEGAGLSCGASGQAVTSHRVIRRAPIRSGRTIQMTSEVPACAHWVALMTYSVIWPRARA
jgi:hypothetical protein